MDHAHIPLARPRRVLFIAQDTLGRRLSTMMNMLGHHALTVAPGEHALQAFATFDPDAVVVDLDAPHAQDLDLARRLRALARRRAPLLVALGEAERLCVGAKVAGYDRRVREPGSVHEIERLILSRPILRMCRRQTDPVQPREGVTGVSAWCAEGAPT